MAQPKWAENRAKRVPLPIPAAKRRVLAQNGLSFKLKMVLGCAHKKSGPKAVRRERNYGPHRILSLMLLRSKAPNRSVKYVIEQKRETQAKNGKQIFGPVSLLRCALLPLPRIVQNDVTVIGLHSQRSYYSIRQMACQPKHRADK